MSHNTTCSAAIYWSSPFVKMDSNPTITIFDALSDLEYKFGFNFGYPRDLFCQATRAKSLSDRILAKVRQYLFELAQYSNLVSKGADLVSRRSTSLKPISEKHIEDIWELADNVASNNHVKRTLLKSGKRNQTYLTKKWDRSAADHLGHISLFNINADDQINCSSHTCSSVGDSQLVADSISSSIVAGVSTVTITPSLTVDASLNGSYKLHFQGFIK